MRAAALSARTVFAAATAVTAAALGDPIVEGLANAGVFGVGRFTDRSSIDVVPALLVGLLLALIFVGSVVRRILMPRWRASAWIEKSALALPAMTVRRMLPMLFAVQLAVVFVMESLEQCAVFGHLLGGHIWLGGPIVVSLAIHAAVGVAVAYVFAQSLRRVATRISAFIRIALQLVVRLALPVQAARFIIISLPPRRLPLGRLAHLRERAPPHLV